VQYGSRGGWSPFGPERLITRSDNNELYELDDQSALELYERYLGPYAKELPASGLLFPLKVKTPQNKEFVRTLLGIDREKDTMTFAGDLPEGAYARFMRANHDRLIEGAQEAAAQTKRQSDDEPELAILISCIGRRLVLDQRVEEETEIVRQLLGDNVTMTGYYSYGEICPIIETGERTLHNQTMTITTLKERQPSEQDRLS